MWDQYVQRMSPAYFELVVDYIKVLVQQGIYSVEDAIVFNDVFCKYLHFNVFTELFNIESDAKLGYAGNMFDE